MVKSQNLAIIYHVVIPPGIPKVTFSRAGCILTGKYDLVVAVALLPGKVALFYHADVSIGASFIRSVYHSMRFLSVGSKFSPSAYFRFHIATNILAIWPTLTITTHLVGFHYQAIVHGGRIKRSNTKKCCFFH